MSKPMILILGTLAGLAYGHQMGVERERVDWCIAQGGGSLSFRADHCAVVYDRGATKFIPGYWK